MSVELRDLYLELLEQLARANGRWRTSPLTAFAALRGANDAGALMVVGRAVNGWTSEWHAHDAADVAARERIVAEAFAPTQWNDGDPMLWVSRCWGATDGYNTRKSAFWRAIRAIAERLRVADVSTTTWPSFISWSNLYKISPATGGNPSSTLATAQLAKCIEILRAEIRTWSPRRVLFLTGRSWAEPFLEGLEFVPDAVPPVQPVEAKGTVFNGARALVAPHPQARAEDPLITAVVGTFDVAKQADAPGRPLRGRR